ncbi:MAG: hypothetical protein V4857_28255 [Pseudomonadota bacterium]
MLAAQARIGPGAPRARAGGHKKVDKLVKKRGKSRIMALEKTLPKAMPARPDPRAAPPACRRQSSQPGRARGGPPARAGGRFRGIPPMPNRRRARAAAGARIMVGMYVISMKEYKN